MADHAHGAGADFQRRTASSCNDAAWNLIERPDLDATDLTRLLTLAATARHHWHEIGTPTNIAHADLLFAWAMARAGAGASAVELAEAVLSHFHTANAATWERAFAHAAMAVACRAVGDGDRFRRHYAGAAALGAELSGENSTYFHAAFKTVSESLGKGA